ncbi:MAG: hypothetical protein OHK0024_03900 [Thalassobaculales bacterium]
MFRQTALTESAEVNTTALPQGAVRVVGAKDIDDVLREARALRAVHTARLLLGIVGAVVRFVIEPLRSFRKRQETYAELMSLDDHVLRDIGIARSDIQNIAFGAANANDPRRAA